MRVSFVSFAAAVFGLTFGTTFATPPERVSEALLEMRLLGTVIESYQQEFGTHLAPGQPYLYRANRWSYQVVSFGADGEPDQDYGAILLGAGALSQATDSANEKGDLILWS